MFPDIGQFVDDVVTQPVRPKEDRDAYERGQDEREAQDDNPIGYLLDPWSADRGETESEQAAYDKGLNGEQLDEDKE